MINSLELYDFTTFLKRGEALLLSAVEVKGDYLFLVKFSTLCPR